MPDAESSVSFLKLTFEGQKQRVLSTDAILGRKKERQQFLKHIRKIFIPVECWFFCCSDVRLFVAQILAGGLLLQ